MRPRFPWHFGAMRTVRATVTGPAPLPAASWPAPAFFVKPSAKREERLLFRGTFWCRPAPQIHGGRPRHSSKILQNRRTTAGTTKFVHEVEAYRPPPCSGQYGRCAAPKPAVRGTPTACLVFGPALTDRAPDGGKLTEVAPGPVRRWERDIPGAGNDFQADRTRHETDRPKRWIPRPIFFPPAVSHGVARGNSETFRSCRSALGLHGAAEQPVHSTFRGLLGSTPLRGRRRPESTPALPSIAIGPLGAEVFAESSTTRTSRWRPERPDAYFGHGARP